MKRFGLAWSLNKHAHDRKLELRGILRSLKVFFLCSVSSFVLILQTQHCVGCRAFNRSFFQLGKNFFYEMSFSLLKKAKKGFTADVQVEK